MDKINDVTSKVQNGVSKFLVKNVQPFRGIHTAVSSLIAATRDHVDALNNLDARLKRIENALRKRDPFTELKSQEHDDRMIN